MGRKGLPLLIMALIIASIGFGYYLGKSAVSQAEKKGDVSSNWQTYKSKLGWQIKYPASMTVATSSPLIYDPTPTNYGVLFMEKYPWNSKITVGTIKKSPDTSFFDWVSQWVQNHKKQCSCKVSDVSENMIQFNGSLQGITIFEDNSYSGQAKDYYFLSLNDHMVLWSEGTTEEHMFIPESTINLQREMLKTFTMPGITYAPTPSSRPIN
jgi:hypothetical protein